MSTEQSPVELLKARKNELLGTDTPVQPDSCDIEQNKMRKLKELLAKVRVTRSSEVLSRNRIWSKDPGESLPTDKHFCWVARIDSVIVNYTIYGYTISKDPRIMSNWLKEDGTHIYGDSILMECPREVKEMIDLDSEIRALEGIDGGESFKEYAHKTGIPVSTLKH